MVVVAARPNHHVPLYRIVIGIPQAITVIISQPRKPLPVLLDNTGIHLRKVVPDIARAVHTQVIRKLAVRKPEALGILLRTIVECRVHLQPPLVLRDSIGMVHLA